MFAKCNDIRRFGACAPELCNLAMGRCELYFEYLLSPWDFTAASLILTEAGGVIAGLNGETPDFVCVLEELCAEVEERVEEPILPIRLNTLPEWMGGSGGEEHHQ